MSLPALYLLIALVTSLYLSIALVTALIGVASAFVAATEVTRSVFLKKSVINVLKNVAVVFFSDY